MIFAFYITDHGFGHMMRNVAVIEELLKRDHTVLLVTAKPQIEAACTELSEQYPDRFKAFPMHTDTGLIVRKGSLSLDVPAMEKAVREYTDSFEKMIEEAICFFGQYRVDRVIVDVVPWVLTAAKRAGIPSYLMASFTWIEQYEGVLSEELIAPYRRAYADADRVLFYALANEPTRQRFTVGEEVGFCARQIHPEVVERIKATYDDRIVFVSVGASNSGLNRKIDVSGLPYTFVMTRGLDLEGDNVVDLPPECPNTQDYVAASRYCISKAGWTTIAEIMIAGVPSALLWREDVAEDRLYIEALENEGAAVRIFEDELADPKSLMDRLEKISFSVTPHENGALRIADLLEKNYEIV